MNATISFDAFRNSVLAEIQELRTLLMTPLSDNPAHLQILAKKVEAWYGRITTLLAHANAILDAITKDKLPAKEPGRTDLDRQAELDAAVSRERQLRDDLQGLVKAIELKVSLAQSIIKANSVEHRFSGP